METQHTLDILKVVLYSGLVLLFIYLLGLYLRRIPVLLPKGRRMEVLEKIPLGSRQMLYLIRIDGEDLLLGTSEKGMSLLKEFPGIEGRDGDHGEVD